MRSRFLTDKRTSPDKAIAYEIGSNRCPSADGPLCYPDVLSGQAFRSIICPPDTLTPRCRTAMRTCSNALNKWPRSGQANFFEIPRNRVLRGSRQSDSNRRPADYKSAALDQLSYAGAFLGKLRLREAHTTLFRTERNLIISVRPTRVFGNADRSGADRTWDRAGEVQE